MKPARGAGEYPFELGLSGDVVREGDGPAKEGGELLAEVGAGDEVGAGPTGADGAVGDEGEGLGDGLGYGGSGGEVDGLLWGVLGWILGLGAGCRSPSKYSQGSCQNRVLDPLELHLKPSLFLTHLHPPHPYFFAQSIKTKQHKS